MLTGQDILVGLGVGDGEILIAWYQAFSSTYQKSKSVSTCSTVLTP